MARTRASRFTFDPLRRPLTYQALELSRAASGPRTPAANKIFLMRCRPILRMDLSGPMAVSPESRLRGVIRLAGLRRFVPCSHVSIP